MPTLREPDYDYLNVSSLFQSQQYYRVTEYQRAYSWGDGEVGQLLEDLLSAFRDSPDETYLLGQLIVCRTRKIDNRLPAQLNQLDLIDGQQRCTTLLILLIAIRQNLISSEWIPQSEVDKEWLQNLERLVSFRNKSDLLMPRVKPASNGDVVLSKLLSGEEVGEPEGPTQANIESAWEYLNENLSTSFSLEGKLKVDDLLGFTDFLLYNVGVVRLTLESYEHAVRIFQKINNRGLQLDDADLVKSFLFVKASNDEYEKFSELWDDASKALFKSKLKRVKSMEFLLKCLIGIRTGQSISTTRLFEEWEKELKGNQRLEIQKFVNSLRTQAQYLSRISHGRTPEDGEPDRNFGLGIMLHKSIQQFEVQLAGSSLSVESYLHLLRVVEDRTLLGLWAGEPTQLFERVIHKWAKEISELDRNASLGDIQDATKCTFELISLNELISDAREGIQRLDYRRLNQRERIRYLLARIYRAAQMEVKESADIKNLLVTTKKNSDERGYDLDHLLPQSGKNEWRQDRGRDSELGKEDRFDKKVNSIGNLILLHSRDNRSQQDALPWDQEKKTNLAASGFVLNQTLVETSDLGKRQKVVLEKIAVWKNQYLQTVDKWDEERIDLRAKLYWSFIETELRTSLVNSK